MKKIVLIKNSQQDFLKKFPRFKIFENEPQTEFIDLSWLFTEPYFDQSLMEEIKFENIKNATEKFNKILSQIREGLVTKVFIDPSLLKEFSKEMEKEQFVSILNKLVLRCGEKRISLEICV